MNHDIYQHANAAGRHRDYDLLGRWKDAYQKAYKQASWTVPAKRLKQCGKRGLQVQHYKIPGLPSFQLVKNPDACLSRLCPICARSVAMKSMFKLMGAVEELDWQEKGLIPLFLTLTVPAVLTADLKQAIDNLLTAWKRFRELKQIKRAFVGTFRSLETNICQKKRTANPHFHVLLFARADYFKSKSGLYLRQKEIIRLWRQSTGIPNTKVVDIRRIKPNPNHDSNANPLMGAVLEVAKYCVKTTSIITDPYGPNPTVDPELLDHLHSALRGRRLHAYTGVLAKAARTAKEKENDEEKPNFLPEDAIHHKTETWNWR